MNKLIGFALLALLLSVSPVGYAKKQSLLIGSWELCEDPDGSAKDVMEFAVDGTAKVLRQTGRVTTGKYLIENNTINLVFIVNGNTISVPLTMSADKKKIFFYSDNTKNTSYYVRLGNPEKFECTAK